MKRPLVRILAALMAVAGLGGVRHANAQSAYGYSSLSITAYGVYSTSMTDLDYVAQAYYSVETDAYLYAGSPVVASGSAYSNGTYVDLYYPTYINTSYWIQTNHWVIPYAGGSVPNFGCVSAGWYVGSFGVSACGWTTSPSAVYIGSSYASGNTDGSPPSISYVDQTTYGTAVAGTSGYAIVYGSNLATPYGATSAGIGGGISYSITYIGQSQVNIYYSIPVGTPAGAYQVYVETPYGTAYGSFSVYPPPPPLMFSNVLPVGIMQAPYSAALSASGGTPPYQWSLVSGSSLPAGLSFSAPGGIISGTPTVSGTSFGFNIEVTDANGMTLTETVYMAIASVTISQPSPGQPTLTAGGSPLTITFTLAVTVFANFTVEAPTNAQVQAAIGSPGIIYTQPPPPYYLALAGVPPGYGITFTPAATQPADFNGNFVWGQVIDSIIVTWFPSSLSPTNCSATAALDTGFPYTANNPTNPSQAIDSPSMQLLQSGMNEESYLMSSHMYLMWQPDFPPAARQPTISVPLGSVQWSWLGDAEYVGTGPTNWALLGDGYARPTPPAFVAGALFPTWNSVFVPSAPGTCPTAYPNPQL